MSVTERQIHELATLLRNAETDRDEYKAAGEELAADLRVVKEQLHVAEQLLEERPDLVARYQALIRAA